LQELQEFQEQELQEQELQEQELQELQEQELEQELQEQELQEQELEQELLQELQELSGRDKIVDIVSFSTFCKSALRRSTVQNHSWCQNAL
jgi:hypothetical protein